ncbi:MAG: HIT domain-containing protein [Verrucomicrobiia bacterium]
MDHLWAPWRSAYLQGDAKPTPDIFSRIAADSDDETNLVLLRTKASFSLLNRYPYNTGHLLVLPYRPVTSPEELSPDETLDLWATANRLTAALRTAFQPDGFNLGFNLGSCAGAGLPAHLHLHIVPRWHGDANFMTVTAHTRVHPHDLPTVYARLKDTLAA